MDYVVFDLEALDEMFRTIWMNAGSIANIAIYTFIIVLSVFLLFEYVRGFV